MSSLSHVDWEEARRKFRQLLEHFPSVTVLSHIRPDPDAVGSSLGVYHLLKSLGKRVEIANASREIPRTLDFLEGYKKIKWKMDYEDSLIVSCDCGSLDRLGFEGLEERTIVNLDHHVSNSRFGTLNVVDPTAVSTSEVAYRLFEGWLPVRKESAEAFYAALISDTRHFTTSNVTAETFVLARSLIERGADPATIAQMMLQRRSLASLRILGKALESLRLYADARVAIMRISREDLAATGATVSDLDGVVDYARSLVTVEVAALVVEMKNEIKVSLRSKGINLLPVAEAFGGGGHREAVGFEVPDSDSDALIKALLHRIEKEGVLTKQ